jgi:hypothetical protein
MTAAIHGVSLIVERRQPVVAAPKIGRNDPLSEGEDKPLQQSEQP